MTRPHRSWLVPAAASLLLAAGCGTSEPESDHEASTAETPAKTSEAAPSGFPVTLDDCGVTTTYDRPPERAVALNQESTETLLALGLQDSLVGTAYRDDAVLPEYQDDYDRVPVLADKYPSYEDLLATQPDFVYGNFTSAFDEKGGRSRQRLSDAGINTYLNIGQCASAPVTMDLLDDELRNIGSVFGVDARAEAEIDRLHGVLSDAEDKVGDAPPVDVVVYDSGETTAFTAGGHGIGNEVITRAGGTNLFADQPETFTDVSFEQFAERAPDVIIVYDYGDTSVEHKKQFLLDNPVLHDVPAVRDQRFAVLPLSSMVLGVRAPGAVDTLARQLHPDRFE